MWHLGYPDQAVQTCDGAVDVARPLSHPSTLALALAFGAWIRQLRRERRAAEEGAEAAIAVAREHEIPFFLAWTGFTRGWALAEQGRTGEAIDVVRHVLADWHAIGSEAARPWFLGVLAEAHGKADQPEEGLTLLAEALTQVEQTGERFSEAELLRLRGELLLQQTRGNRTRAAPTSVAVAMEPAFIEAESSFRQAIDVARRQHAKSWELRAVTSLSRLLAERGRRAEAHAMLGEIYGWFTEGFDTADLKDAKALLEALA